MPEAEMTAGPALLSDELAIKQVQGGNSAAFENIMRRYNQRLFRVARSILQDDDAAQDAAQEAWVSVWFKLGQFSPGGSFGAWLTRIVINEALMIRRKNRRHEQQRDAGDIGEKVDIRQVAIAEPADATLQNEFRRLIEKAVDRLPDEFRTVFVLRAVQQLSVKETAECLDLNPATVKTRFHRARNLMQASLNQHLDVSSPGAFEFAGSRCDRIVASVFERLALPPSAEGSH